MKTIIRIILALSLVLIWSCEDMLKEKPFSFTSPEEVPDSPEGADLWVHGVYRYVYYTWYSSTPILREQDCDYNTGPTWSYGNLGTGNFQGETELFLLWEGPYKTIAMANNAIKYISDMTNLTDQKRESVLGELYFIKAWSYYFLVRDFGPIPVYYTADELTWHHPRQPVTEVYDHIIELLKDAESMLPKNTDDHAVLGRVTAGAAASLLADVYLTIASSAKSGVTISVNGGPAIDHSVTGTPHWHMYTRPGIEVKCEKKHPVNGFSSYDADEYFRLARDKAWDVISGQYGTYSLYDEWLDIWKPESENKVENIWSFQSTTADSHFATSIPPKWSGQWSAEQVTLDHGTVKGAYLVNSLFAGATYHWYELFEDDVDERVVNGVIHSYQNGTTTGPTTIGIFAPVNEKWQRRAANREAPWFDNPEMTRYQMDGGRIFIGLTKHLFHRDLRSYNTDMVYPLIRLAQVYLIYAEAKNEVDAPSAAGTTGADPDALYYLNKVRERSNATPYYYQAGGPFVISDRDHFRTVVLEERARELAMENGIRRYDLLRWGIYLTVMNAFQGTDEAGLAKSRTEKHLLYPIPSSEISANDEINENNPGWR